MLPLWSIITSSSGVDCNSKIEHIMSPQLSMMWRWSHLPLLVLDKVHAKGVLAFDNGRLHFLLHCQEYKGLDLL